MKETNTEEMLSSEEIRFNIKQIFRILKNENIPHDESDVVLFLLIAYKYNVISDDLINENHHLKEKLCEQLRNFNIGEANQYKPIIISIMPSIQKLSEKGLKQLLGIIEQLNKKVTTEDFPIIFDAILYQVCQLLEKHSYGFIASLTLSRFMFELADLKKDAKVFNPFAGFASFGVHFSQSQEYLGQELNQKTWIIGTLRLMAYNKQDALRYVCEDSILNWPEQTLKFDLIISNPSYERITNTKFKDIYPNIKHSVEFLFIQGIKSLSDNGKLIALFAETFVSNGGEEYRIRKYLVEEDLIDTVILPPNNLLFETDLSNIILILVKTKKFPGRVRFVNARNFIKDKESKEKVLDTYSLNSFINSNKEENNIVKFASNEQIRNNEYILDVKRYLLKEIDGIKLGDILKLVKGQRRNLPQKGKLIDLNDLKDDKFDFTLDVSKIEETEVKSPYDCFISDSCLLLATAWSSKLMPTFFEFKDEPIFIWDSISAFKINERRVDKAYLINELHADYVQEQLNAYLLSDSFPDISINDLLRIVIKLPSIKEQRAKIQGVYESYEEIKSLQQKINTLTHDMAKGQTNEFASLKHTLGRPRQNILDWVYNLLYFLSKNKNDFEQVNKSFSEFYDHDIIWALNEIKQNLNFITDVLKNGEKGLILSEYEKHIISLSEINSIISNIPTYGLKFKIKKLRLKGENLKKMGIHANKTLFRTLLDNILTNADKHAFDEKEANNEVVIELTKKGEFLSMEIKNNGKPFPKNFDREKFITRFSKAGSKGGSGLGGYDIHRIASYFNNPDWLLLLNEDPIFAVKFKFQFQIKPIN